LEGKLDGELEGKFKTAPAILGRLIAKRSGVDPEPFCRFPATPPYAAVEFRGVCRMRAEITESFCYNESGWAKMREA